MAKADVKMLMRAILLVIIAGLLYSVKGDPGECRPVDLHISFSGDANILRSASKAVLDVTSNLPTDSTLAIVAQGSYFRHIFDGTVPVEMDRLEKILEEHRQSDFPSSNMLHGQQLMASMNQTWDTTMPAAKLSLVITSGGFDGDKAWEIRETVVVTVLQLEQADHHQPWSSITPDKDHYLRVDENGSIPIKQISDMICGDSSMVCGTTNFAVFDLDSFRCDDCRTICRTDYLDEYCNDTCPYFKLQPEPPKLTTTPEVQVASSNDGTIITIVGLQVASSNDGTIITIAGLALLPVIAIIVAIAVSIWICRGKVSIWICRGKKNKPENSWHRGNARDPVKDATDHEMQEMHRMMPEQGAENCDKCRGCVVCLKPAELDLNPDALEEPMNAIR